MAMIGPNPIETVGNSQKSGMSQGWGYGAKSAARLQLAAEIHHVLLGQSAQQECPRVDARRGVPLEEDLVGRFLALLAAEEVVEGHFVKRRRRGEG